MKYFSFKTILSLSLFACTATYAQQETIDTAAFRKIRNAELNSSQIPQIAHYLTDVSGPRLTNSPGYKRAATWAVETMKKWGLTNAKMEPWGEFGKQWEVQDFSISMRAPYMQSVRAYPGPWSANTKGLQQGQVMLLTPANAMDTAYLASHAADFKGKFVLVTGVAASSAERFEPSATRLADTALANLKDAYMIDKSTIQMYKGYFKIFAKVDELLKSSGALAYITTGSNNHNGTVVVQGYGGYKTTQSNHVGRRRAKNKKAHPIRPQSRIGFKYQRQPHNRRYQRLQRGCRNSWHRC
jgi:hypothetical protein